MEKWILRNWLILAIASLLVGFYIAFFEDFVHDKAWIFFLLAILFAFVWLRKRGSV
jgi:hypothetical protein